MLHKKSWQGLGTVCAIAVAAAVGMTAVGCGGSDSSSPTTPTTPTTPSLVGTWNISSQDGAMTCKLESNNTFEMKLDENLFSKGTYTANQPNFTLTVTHAHGATFNAKIEEMFGEMLEEWSISIPPGTFAIESKWYTKNELKTAISDKFAGIAGIGLDGFGFSDEDFEEGFGYMFEPHNGTYHFDSDNKLAVTYRDETNREITNIFTRQ